MKTRPYISRSTGKPGPEREQIENLRQQVASYTSGRTGSTNSRSGWPSALRLGIGDDCAILRPPSGHELLVTTDFSLETIHFRRDWHSPESAGHRCLARGFSDLAAMGAKPLAAFLSLALPRELTLPKRGATSWRDRFFNGLLRLAEQHRVPLAGGDTAESPRWPRVSDTAASGHALADIVLIGSAPRGRALLRSTAKAGDLIYVTGQLGGAAAELAALAAHPQRFAKISRDAGSVSGEGSAHPHLFPQPRLSVGQALLKRRLATAAIDISDGLSTDLDHLCEESGVAAILDAARVPIHPLAAATPEPLQHALHGGEDYELLFTASPATRVPRSMAGVAITCIGTMHRPRRGQPRLQLLTTRNGQQHYEPLLPAGWEHYRAH